VVLGPENDVHRWHRILHREHKVLGGKRQFSLQHLVGKACTHHMKMKLPDLSGRVIVIKSDQEEAKPGSAMKIV